jgi:hypothetical protein
MTSISAMLLRYGMVRVTISSWRRRRRLFKPSKMQMTCADAHAYRPFLPFYSLPNPFNPYLLPISHPDKPERTVIKRIVALEGDVVQTRAPYPETHVRIPRGHCWVEGDELFHSKDSNHYGPVSSLSFTHTYIYILSLSWKGA